MWITTCRCFGCHSFICLSGNPLGRFTNFPGQNDGCDVGADIPDNLDRGRRKIYGGVDFVIGSLREVSEWDRGNAHDGTQ